MPLKHLNKFFSAILSYLTFIINISLRNNTYPDAWKKAFIIPILKVLNPLSPVDTRPIANLCHFAKVFDRIITAQIMNYLEKNNLLAPLQFGSRTNHNTQSALLHLMDEVRDDIEDGLVTLVVLFDFKKAFDSFNHEALLIALKSLGFSKQALQFVYSYITSPSQSVVDNSQLASGYKDVTSGMPQGSSLGPVFFLALINSLPRYLQFCKNSYLLFADDLELYIQCPPNMVTSAIKHMNEDILQVSRWAADQGLTLNAAKTNAIIFGSPANLHYLSNKILPSLMVGDQEIAIANQVKSLGVILISDLTWNAHISFLSQRVHGVLHKLRTRGWLLPQRVKFTLVQTLGLPRIDHDCLVYNDIPAYLQLKIQRLANAGIRFVFNLRRDVSISPYRAQLGWPTLILRLCTF